MQVDRTKPCIALMGEFSAGKSTLANLLIGSSPLPTRIIATQLPPVRISHGNGEPYMVDLAGNETPLDLEALDHLDINATRFLQLFSTEELLTHCDLLDMPGISDPNMSSDVWERMINEAQAVIWCSHAVQAWRQSEAAVWAEMPSTFHDKSLLLLTQIDKVNSATDRERIVRRVQRETTGLFRAVLPISLLSAIQEQNDYDNWSRTGADEFVHQLIALLNDLNAGQQEAEARLVSGLTKPETTTAPAAEVHPAIQPRRVKAARHGRL